METQRDGSWNEGGAHGKRVCRSVCGGRIRESPRKPVEDKCRGVHSEGGPLCQSALHLPLRAIQLPAVLPVRFHGQGFGFYEALHLCIKEPKPLISGGSWSEIFFLEAQIGFTCNPQKVPFETQGLCML